MTWEAEWVVAFATVVLVAVTGFYAWRTSRMAEATKAIADATGRSVDIATAVLILQHAPIVVPRPAGGGGSTAPDGTWNVGVTVQNIGGAPAFGVELKVHVGSEEFSGGPYGTLEPNEQPRKTNCSIRYRDFVSAGQAFTAVVEYRDILNRRYRVTRSTKGEIAVELQGESLGLLRGSLG